MNTKQSWTFTEGLDTEFVEIDYVDVETAISYGLLQEEDLMFLDIRPVYVDSGEIYSPIPADEVTLSSPHDGTSESVVKAIKDEFGVTVKPRPDLGIVVFEIMGGV